jgi:hypothetical protein
MAERHLRERRNLLELAKRIMADREDSLATLDAKYKTRRERLLLKILMTRAGLLHQKRQRLICRLGVISKVIVLLVKYNDNLSTFPPLHHCLFTPGLPKRASEAL